MLKRLGLVLASGLMLLSAACGGGTPPTPTKAPASAATATSLPAQAATATPAAQPTKPAASAATAQPSAQATAPAKPTTPAASKGPTGPIHGEIAADTVWTKAGSPYLIDAPVYVVAPATLTVEPGVEVRFAPQSSLDIRGKLKAMGTVTEPITFTADGNNPTPGWWSGIGVSGKNATADLDYANILWGGYGRNSSLQAQTDAVVTINHSVVRDGSGDGIQASDRAVAHVSNTQVTGNAGYGIQYTDGSVDPKLAALVIKGNKTDAIAIGAGSLTGTRTWKNLGVPYVVTSNLDVPPGSSRTIEPGVVMSYALQAGLDVRGSLKAIGAADKRIVFTADSAKPSRGWWSGVGAYGKGATADLDYVTIQWGGYGRDSGLEAETDAVVTLNHGVVKDSSGSGIGAADRGVVHVSNTQVAGSEEYGLRYDDGSVNPKLSALTVKGNGIDAIAIGAGTLSGQRTWANHGVPYVITSNLDVPAGSTLTIEPGVVLRYAVQSGLDVRGVLRAVGPAAQPIVFTADGDTPAPGWWAGIGITGSVARLEMDYVTVRYAGYGRPGSIDLSEGPKATIAHATIRDGSAAGVHVWTKGSNVTISNSQFLALEGFGVENAEPDSPVMAANNWWGAPTGPTADDNPGGTGAGVSEGVTYKPFLTAAP